LNKAEKVGVAPLSVLGEGPVWRQETGLLYWVDIEGKNLNIYSPSQHWARSVRLGVPAACVVPTSGDGLLVAFENSLAMLGSDGTGMRIAKQIDIGPEVRFNDGKCDAKGRFWVGTMDLQESRPLGCLFVVDRDFSATKVLDGITISNGLAWSPNGENMFYIDSPTRRVLVFEYSKEEGKLGNIIGNIDLSSYTGVPDGLTVDSEGMLWVAMWEGSSVLRVDPQISKVVGRIDLPVPRVTCPTFGGDDLATLYITTAHSETKDVGGELFQVEVSTKGLPTNKFLL
jgi:sugar lactone lactonase YvrE